MPDSPTAKRSKTSALAEDGTLNPAPRKVNDPKFREESFFDPRDIVQVKYEMLRRVSVDKMSVTQVSDEYGVTRPTFYQAKADFEGARIAGLVPRKRGPRGPHKIQSEVLAFLKAQVSPGEPIRARELTNLVRGEFGLDDHAALGLHRDDVGGLRLRTVATKNRACADFPWREGEGYEAHVVLELDYWALAPRRP